MADQPADPRVGSVIAGYRIEQRVGRGGMGVVYRAQHLNLRRRAAIKIIAPELADEAGFHERFIREARIAAALAHPNIVTVYDAGEADGVLYIAMQYIEGADLAATLRREGRVRPYRALDVGRQVAAALDAAHAMGLIHRDVKPANVLIEGRRAFLSDFGLTKRIDASRTGLTRAGEVVGTIHYVAPEQIEGRDVEARTDVYALGCLLFHCLTGQVPFARDTDVAVIYAHLSEPPPRASAANPELAPGIDAVIARALEKAPERRFSTCGDLMAAARAVIDAAGPLSDTMVGRGASAPVAVPGASSLGVVAMPANAASAPRRARLLLAGLDEQTRALVRVAVGERVEVEEAAGADILLSAREGRPDLVLVDATRAGTGAGRLVEALRADAVTRDAKVLLVVPRGGRAGAAAAADETLAVPFSPLQLQVKLRKLLGTEALAG